MDELPVPNYFHDKLSNKDAKVKFLELNRSSIHTLQIDQEWQPKVASPASIKKLGLRSNRKNQPKDEL
jgi:hypothetical protein